MTIFFAVMTGVLIGLILGGAAIAWLTIEMLDDVVKTLKECESTMQACDNALEVLEKRLEKTTDES